MALRLYQKLRHPFVPPSNLSIKATPTRRFSVHNSITMPQSDHSRKVLLRYPLFFLYYLLMLFNFSL